MPTTVKTKSRARSQIVRNQTDILAKIVSDISRDLIAIQEANGRGKGASADHLVLINQDKVELKVVPYYRFVLFGRGPGGFPPPPRIAEWINSRGISGDDLSLNQLTFLIGRKIAMEGTEAITTRSDVDAIMERAFNKNKKLLGDAFAKDTANQITAIWD